MKYFSLFLALVFYTGCNNQTESGERYVNIESINNNYELLFYINEFRDTQIYCGSKLYNSTNKLTINWNLNNMAEEHGFDLMMTNRFSHTGSGGRYDPSKPEVGIGSDIILRARNNNYEPNIIGENLAKGFSTPKEVVEAWITSPLHCENVMDPLFKDVGFSTYRLGERIIYVANFGRTND